MATKDDKFNEWSLKVLQELVTLNARYEQLASELEDRCSLLQHGIEERTAHLERKIDRINEVLNGGGSPEKGMVVRMDRLEQNEQRRTWLLRTTVVSCIGAIVATVTQWLKKS